MNTNVTVVPRLGYVYKIMVFDVPWCCTASLRTTCPCLRLPCTQNWCRENIDAPAAEATFEVRFPPAWLRLPAPACAWKLEVDALFLLAPPPPPKFIFDVKREPNSSSSSSSNKDDTFWGAFLATGSSLLSVMFEVKPSLKPSSSKSETGRSRAIRVVRGGKVVLVCVR